jgi:Zn-dependent protease
MSCPKCGQLVHSVELKALSAEAERARLAGDARTEIAAWERALGLLPVETRQHEILRARLAELSLARDASPATPKPGPSPRGVAGLGALAVVLLSKGKWLLAALLKVGPSLLSMLACFGVYWVAWGWKFAAGLLASIYVHELGHIAMLRWYGIGSTLPMFIPGVGAFVRPRRYPESAVEIARVGLAGPVFGLAAAAVAYAAFVASGAGAFAAIAKLGGFINLFNLLPMPPLDGGHGVRSLASWQRWVLAMAIAGAWMWTGEGLLVLILVVAVLRCFEAAAPKAPDVPGMLLYAALVLALTLLATLHVRVDG